jgi:hypothetical protein
MYVVGQVFKSNVRSSANLIELRGQMIDVVFQDRKRGWLCEYHTVELLRKKLPLNNINPRLNVST